MFMLLLAVGALFPQAARAAASATVTVAAKQVYTGAGAGSGGVPAITFNVTAGGNRLLAVAVNVERDQCTQNWTYNTLCHPGVGASNWANPNVNVALGSNVSPPSGFQIRAQGALSALTSPRNAAEGFWSFPNCAWVTGGNGTSSYCNFTMEHYAATFYESELRALLGGNYTGPVTITFPNISLPKRAQDEIAVYVVQFNNVNQQTTAGAGAGITWQAYYNFTRDASRNVTYALGLDAQNNWSAAASGVNTSGTPDDAADGSWMIAQNGYGGAAPNAFLPASPAFSILDTVVISDTVADFFDPINGGPPTGPATEYDGLSMSYQFRNGIWTPATNGAPTIVSQEPASVTRTSGGIYNTYLINAAAIDLSVTKTDGKTSTTQGAANTYTIVVSNLSTLNYADGTVFTDPAASSLTKTLVSCGSPTSGAVCPDLSTAAYPNMAAVISALEGGGLTIPRLPPNGSVTFTVTTTVATTATTSVTNIANVAAPAGYTDTATANNSVSDTDTIQAGFGTCDGRLWLSQTATMYAINTSSNPFAYTPVATSAFNYNAGDFNPADNYMYAVRVQNSNRLVRIDATGVATDLGAVGGLPVATYISGAFTTSGNTLYVLNNASPTSTMYAINVTTMTATAITLSRGVDIADIAYVGGLFYSVENNGQLISINPATGQVTNIGSPNGVTNGVYFGGLFGAPNGLFGIANNGGFYSIDLTTGAVTLISSAPISSSNEGYHCPAANLTFGADLAITKTDGTTLYTPGGTTTYTIVVSNSGPFGAANNTVSDPLPTGITTATWTCTGSNGGTCTASGTGAINDTTVDLPVGASVTYTLTLTIPATFTGDLVNTATVTAGTGTSETNLTNNTATDTDFTTRIVIVKDAVPNDAQDFTFTTTGTGLSDFSLDDDADATLSNTRTFVALAPGSYSVTETAVAGWSLTGLTCSDPSGNTTTTGTTANINLAAGETVTCTYTNTKQPVIRLQKSLPSGRFLTADQFALSIAGAGAPAPVTTTGSGSTATGTVTVNPATIGSAYTLSETAAAGANLANYTSTYNCTNALAGGQAPSGSGTSFNVTPVAGDDLTCTLINTRKPKADLSITKTNTPGVNSNVDQASDTVTSGNTTTYSIVVSNAGPDAANGSIVRDTSAGGLTCTQAMCTSTSGGATCPVETGAALLGGLQGSGVAIPQLPVGGSVTLTLTCTVP